MSKVMTGPERKASLLLVGAKLAAKHGAVNVTRTMVAKAAGVSQALVSRYMGESPNAQKAYARKAKALGLVQPSKDRIATIGAKLRAHGPRDARDTRKRSIKEVQAIKRKQAVKAPAKAVAKKSLTGARIAAAAVKAIGGGKNMGSKAVTAKKSAPVRATVGESAVTAQPVSRKPAVSNAKAKVVNMSKQSPGPATTPNIAPPSTAVAAPATATVAPGPASTAVTSPAAATAARAPKAPPSGQAVGTDPGTPSSGN